MKTQTPFVVLVSMLVGCATDPSIRPRPRVLIDTKEIVSQEAKSKYADDLYDCDQYVQQVAGMGTNAAAGAVLGALFGTVISRAAGSEYDHGAAARVGAVAGGVGGAAKGAQDETGVFRECMRGRGYKVLN